MSKIQIKLRRTFFCASLLHFFFAVSIIDFSYDTIDPREEGWNLEMKRKSVMNDWKWHRTHVELFIASYTSSVYCNYIPSSSWVNHIKRNYRFCFTFYHEQPFFAQLGHSSNLIKLETIHQPGQVKLHYTKTIVWTN